MDNFIPITDFDKRLFPEVTEDEKVQFIVNSNGYERIIHKPEFVQANLLIPQKADPAVSGQMMCIHLITDLAENQNLIPLKIRSLDSDFPYIKKLHKNLLFHYSKKGEELFNLQDYPSPQELGNFRTEEKFLAHRKMPSPELIQNLLLDSLNSYISVFDVYRDFISNPRMIEKNDWITLENAIHKVNLDICCIKPFRDGSNRVARLVENLLRLNIGLKFKTFKNQDLPNELWKHQDNYYST